MSEQGKQGADRLIEDQLAAVRANSQATFHLVRGMPRPRRRLVIERLRRGWPLQVALSFDAIVTAALAAQADAGQANGVRIDRAAPPGGFGDPGGARRRDRAPAVRGALRP